MAFFKKIRPFSQPGACITHNATKPISNINNIYCFFFLIDEPVWYTFPFLYGLELFVVSLTLTHTLTTQKTAVKLTV